MSIVLVKLAYSTEEIGNFEWFLFIANTASFFWSLGLKNAFMSYFPTIDEDRKKDLVFNVFVLFLVLGVVASLIVYMISGRLLDVSNVSIWFLIPYVVFGVSASLSEHFLIVWDEAKTLFNYGWISYSLYFVGLCSAAWYIGDVNALFSVLVMWSLLRFAYLMNLVMRYGRFNFDLRMIGRFALFGSPLILHVLLGGGMEYVDGYLVESFFSRSEFTLFRYGVRELPINTIFISALASASIPLAVSALYPTLGDVKLRLSKLMNWLFPISAILILLSPTLYRLVYNDEYVMSAHIFNIYLLILCSRILLPQVVLYAKHKNLVLMWVGLVELVVNVCLSLWLMNVFGILGIAYATVIAYMLQKVILVAYNHLVLDVRLSQYIDLKKYLIFSLMLYSVYITSLYLS